MVNDPKNSDNDLSALDETPEEAQREKEETEWNAREAIGSDLDTDSEIERDQLQGEV